MDLCTSMPIQEGETGKSHRHDRTENGKSRKIFCIRLRAAGDPGGPVYHFGDRPPGHYNRRVLNNMKSGPARGCLGYGFSWGVREGWDEEVLCCRVWGQSRRL